MKKDSKELPIIQKTYDLVKWYVPILNRLPRDHRFLLGDRIITQLYETMEALIKARYAKDKLMPLEAINARLVDVGWATRFIVAHQIHWIGV